MITPRFKLSQTGATLTINIRAPYCNLKELEVCVEEEVFLFICRPYYLRLTFPGAIIENDNSDSTFDANSGEFTFTYEKMIAGEIFPNLDFITKFLTQKVEANDGGRKIEVLTSQGLDEDKSLGEIEEQYGFGMRGGYNFSPVADQFSDVFDIDPHRVSLANRCQARIAKENADFNLEHCIVDFLNDEEIVFIMQQPCAWENLSADQVKFTDDEFDFLKDMHNIEYNLSDNQINYCHNSLIDILYAYCYDRRTTYNEGTCESGWTISKLSASLCCFDGFLTAKQAVTTTFRRSLIYPLYRHFDLSTQVLNDLKLLLSLGEKFLVKCLIDLYKIFAKDDSSRYVLNNLFVKDYVTYAMKWNRERWSAIVAEVHGIVITRQDLDLPGIDFKASKCDLLSGEFNKLSLVEEEEEQKQHELDSDDDSNTCSCSDDDDSTSECDSDDGDEEDADDDDDSSSSEE